ASKTTWRWSAFFRRESSSTVLSTTSALGPMEPLTLELRNFIVTNFLFGEASGQFAFSDDDSLQERGIIDSTGILELVCHLQERYAINIADDELMPDNLDSIAKVARFIDRKRADAAADAARAS